MWESNIHSARDRTTGMTDNRRGVGQRACAPGGINTHSAQEDAAVFLLRSWCWPSLALTSETQTRALRWWQKFWELLFYLDEDSKTWSFASTHHWNPKNPRALHWGAGPTVLWIFNIQMSACPEPVTTMSKRQLVIIHIIIELRGLLGVEIEHRTEPS